MADGSEIVSLAAENISATDTRIAVGVRACVVFVLKYEGRGKLDAVCRIEMPNAVPMSISFAGMKGKELYAFGLNDGTM